MGLELRTTLWGTIGLLLAAGCGSSPGDPPGPPAAEHPVEYVGQEQVLRGLDAIYVNPSFLEVRAQGLAVSSDLAQRIERKLEAAGIQPLSAADLERDPGLAELQIYPSASGDGGLGDGPEDACCTANIWVSVLEGTALDRDPEIHRRLPVWGSGSNDSCVAGPVTVDDLVLRVVDHFVEDVLAANRADASSIAATTASPDPS